MAQEKNEQLSGWIKAVIAAVIAGVASYGAFVRGEPGAELSYRELAKSFNELRGEFAKQQAFVEGFLAGVAKQDVVAPGKAMAAQIAQPLAVQPVACKPGLILQGKRCVKVKAVTAAAKTEPKPKPEPKPALPAKYMQQSVPAALPPTLEGLKGDQAAKK